MARILLMAFLITGAIFCLCQMAQAQDTSTATATATSTETPTFTATSTVTIVPTPLPTQIPVSLDQVRVYPNIITNFQPGQSRVTVDQLPIQCEITVYNINWDKIFSFSTSDATNGNVRWFLQNMNGSYVASGLYFIALTDGRGDRKIKKLILAR